MNSIHISLCLHSNIFKLAFTASSNFKFATQVRHGHWFTKYYRYNRLTRPVSQDVIDKYKERSGANLPKGHMVPALLRKYIESSEIPDSVKKIHSYDFNDIEAAIADVTRQQIMELGLDPLLDSTAHEVVRLTVRIRVHREQMDRKRNTAAIERVLLEMLDRRQTLISQLRTEDYASFLSLIKGLELAYQHDPRPQHAEPIRAGFPQRLADVSYRCQKLKLRRLSELARQTEATKADFIRRREATLAEARQKLQTLGLSLEQVLDEVYADRRVAAEKELLDDELHWFYGEQRAHLKYIAKMAEKAGQGAKGRK